MDSTRIECCLNGDWLLVLDPEDVGKSRRWFTGEGLPDGISVRVPAVWDLWVPDYDGVGWYFREFDLNSAWEGRLVAVAFEAADYYAEVWLNGERLGDHEGGYTPFELDATRAITPGRNLLAVRIVDPHGAEGFGQFLPKEIPCAKEEGYFSFAGLWGDVSLIGRPAAHITDVFVQPDIRRKRLVVHITASVAGDVLVGIEGTGHETRGAVGRLALDFPDHELWSPDHPKLYVLRCELWNDGVLADRIAVRFGMREFTVKDNRFCLNGRPFYVKGVLHQPDYPRSLAAPETPELARRELLWAKEAGFNLIRLHIKTAPRITLDLTDELGLLVYEEPPIGWIQSSPWMKQRCEREVREMILRDRNHASVVIWGMLNESGNAGYVVQGGAQVIKEDLCRFARSLDPTRLIIDDSGGVNATREPSRMMRPYHHEMEAYDDLHIYQRAPVDHDIQRYYEHSGQPRQLVFLSEFGFGGMEDLPDVIAQYGEDRHRLKDARFLQKVLDAALAGYAERELDRIFGDFSGFAVAAQELQRDAAQHHIEAIRANPKIGGYCYTQLCDAGHEFCAGVLDRWRRPKPVLDAIKAVQQPLCLLVHIARTNLLPREEAAVRVSIINDLRAEGRAELSLQVVGPTNQVLWKKKRAITLQKTGAEVWSGSISASGSAGPHKFVVRLLQGPKIITENSVELGVFKPTEPADVPIHVLDPRGEWAERCLALAKPGPPNAPVQVVPPLANTIRAYPDVELAEMLAQVHGGAVMLVFGPPDDWNDFAEHVDTGLRATSKDAVGAFLGTYHYVKLHPVFEGLPARCLMRQSYKNIVPPKTFVETGDEDICGTFDTTPIATGNYMIGEQLWWGSDILVRRYGSGRMVFTHLRVLENLGVDPVANRLFVNMLNHFSRRAVPSQETLPVPQHAIDWLRRERQESVRRWMVIGMFPNWGDAGHSTAYPPEERIDLTATYEGWYGPIRWRSWHSRAQDKHLVDLQAVLTPVYEYYPRFDYGTAYAYAEFFSDIRQPAMLLLGVQDATKVWLNGAQIFAAEVHLPHKVLEEHRIPIVIRQGRNAVLVKVSKIPGEFRFSLNLEPTGPDTLGIRWWR